MAASTHSGSGPKGTTSRDGMAPETSSGFLNTLRRFSDSGLKKGHASMSKMSSNQCEVCDAPAEGVQKHCGLCASVLRDHGEHLWLDLVPETLADEARGLLGNLSTSRARWGRLKHSPWVVEAGLWARLEDPDADPISVWHAGQPAFVEAATAARSAQGASNEQQRVLARGVTLCSGHLMQFSDEGLLIDGRGPFPRAPWKDLLELMCAPSRRGWDLLALALAATAVSGPVLQVPRRPLGFGARHGLADHHPGRPLMRWLGLLKRIGEPLDEVTRLWVEGFEERPPLRWQGGGARGPQREALDELIRQRPHQVAVGRQEPWVAGWNTTGEVVHRPLPQALTNGDGRLSLRVARIAQGRDVLTVKVPRDPRLWAWLLAWVLSPPWSEDRARLHAVCVAWNGEAPQGVDPALARSMVLLRTVLNETQERVHVEDDRMLIRGRFGHGYELRVGVGAHMAPFVVRGVDGQGRPSDPPLCITEDRAGPTRPIGDVLASVVLSLLDDVATAETIGPLHNFMHVTSPAYEGDGLRVGNTTLAEALPWFDEASARKHRAFDPFWYSAATVGDGTVLEQQKYVHAWLEATQREEFRPRRRHRRHWQQWLQMQNPPEQGVRAEEQFREALRGNLNLENGNFRNRIQALFEQQQEGENRIQGFANLRGRVHIRDDRREGHQRPDIRAAPLRIRDLYARVWTVLIRSDLGRDIRLEADTPYNVELPTGFRFTVRNYREHQFFRRLLRLSGWVQADDPHDYVRRRGWRQGAQARLARELNRWQHRVGAHGDVPWWWNYPRQEFIDEAVLDDWRFREDLRD